MELKPERAKKFYGIIAVSTLVGIALGFTPIDPIKALYWSAVINGVISVPNYGSDDVNGNRSERDVFHLARLEERCVP